MTTAEGKLKQQVDKYLKALPSCYFFSPVQMGYGKRTIDRLCCINGWFVGIELKAPGEVPTKLQENVIRDIRAAGGIAFWCDSFDEFLSEIRIVLAL